MFHSSTRSVICHSYCYFVDLRGNKSLADHTTFSHPQVHQHALHISMSKHMRNSQSRSLRCNVLLPSTLIDGTRGSIDIVFALIRLNKFEVGNRSLNEKSLAARNVSLLKKKTQHRRKQTKESSVTLCKLFSALFNTISSKIFKQIAQGPLHSKLESKNHSVIEF